MPFLLAAPRRLYINIGIPNPLYMLGLHNICQASSQIQSTTPIAGKIASFSRARKIFDLSIFYLHSNYGVPSCRKTIGIVPPYSPIVFQASLVQKMLRYILKGINYELTQIISLPLTKGGLEGMSISIAAT